MLNAGWHAHKLNAPGKFLISAPEHDTPRRARAYLVTDDDVDGHGRALRSHPPAARRHLTPRAHRSAPAPAVIPGAGRARRQRQRDRARGEREPAETPYGSPCAWPRRTAMGSPN